MAENVDILISYIARFVDAGTRQMIQSDRRVRSEVEKTDRALRGEAKAHDTVTGSAAKTTKQLDMETRSQKAVGDASRMVTRAHDDQTKSLRNLGRASSDTDRDMRRVEVSFGRVNTVLGKFNNQMTFLRNSFKLLKLPAIVAMIGPLIGAIGALAGGVVGLTGALAPLTGALVAYPAILGAVVQGVVTAKIAFGNLDKALKAADPKKFAQEMAKLPPVARKFVTELKSMQPLIEDLRVSAQQGLFPGLTKALRELADPALIGIVRGVLKDTGQVIGDLAKSMSQKITSPEWLKDIQSITDQNVRTIRNLGEALGSILDFTRHMVAGGGPFIDWLGKTTANLAKQAAEWAKVKRESGELTKMFDRTKESLKSVGSFVFNLIDAFQGLASAARPLGMEILAALNKELEEFAKWADTAAGQRTLQAYFNDLKEPLFEIGRLVRDIGKAFIDLSRDPNTTGFINQLRTELLPVLQNVITAASRDLAPAFINLAVEASKFFSVFIGASGPLNAFIVALTEALKLLNKLFTTAPGLQSAMINIVGLFAVFKAVKFTAAITGLSTIYGWMKKIAGVQAGSGLLAMLGGAAGGAMGGRGPAGTRPGALPGAGGWATGAAAGAAGGLLGGLAGGLGAAGRFAVRAIPVVGVGLVAASLVQIVQPTIQRQVTSGLDQAGGFGDAIRGLWGWVRGMGDKLLPGAPLAGRPWSQQGQPGAIRQIAPTGLPGVARRATPAAIRQIAPVSMSFDARSAAGAIAQITRMRTSAQSLEAALQQANAAKEELFTAEVGKHQAELDFLNAKQALQDFQAEKKRLVEEGTMTQRQANAQERVLIDQSKIAWKEYQASIEAANAAKEKASGADSALASGQRAAAKSVQDLTKSYRDAEGQARRFAKATGESISGAAARNAQAYAAKMRELAASFGKGAPEASRFARMAAQLATELGRIPTKKEVKIALNEQNSRAKARALRAYIAGIFSRPVTQVIQVAQSATHASSHTVGGMGGTQRTGGRIHARGGLRVPGPKGKGDVVPAMLSPGEFIVTRSGERMLEQMTGLPGVLSLVEARQTPHTAGVGVAGGFATGGSVSPAARVSRVAQLRAYIRRLIGKVAETKNPRAKARFRDRLQEARQELRAVIRALAQRPTHPEGKPGLTTGPPPGGPGSGGPHGDPPPGTAHVGTAHDKIKCPSGHFAWGGKCWGPGDALKFMRWQASRHHGPSWFREWVKKHPLAAGYLGISSDSMPDEAEGSRWPWAKPRRPPTGGRPDPDSPGGAVGPGGITPYGGPIIGRPYSGTHTLGNWQSDNALDIGGRLGQPIFVVESGRVGSMSYGGPPSSRFGGWGVYVNGRRSWYYKHLMKIASGISTGVGVSRGSILGYMGAGNGVPHLHLGVSSGSPSYFAEGGVVPSPPGASRNRDSIPAMLTPGELVLNTKQQKKLSKLLALAIKILGATGGHGADLGDLGSIRGKARKFGVLDALLASLRGQGFTDAQLKRLARFSGSSRGAGNLASLLGIGTGAQLPGGILGAAQGADTTKIHFHWFEQEWERGERAAFETEARRHGALTQLQANHPQFWKVFDGTISSLSATDRNIHFPGLVWTAAGLVPPPPPGGSTGTPPPSSGGGQSGGGSSGGGTTGDTLACAGGVRYYQGVQYGTWAALKAKLIRDGIDPCSWLSTHSAAKRCYETIDLDPNECAGGGSSACDDDPCSSPDCPGYDPVLCEGAPPDDGSFPGDGGGDGGGATTPEPPSLSEQLQALLAPFSHARNMAQFEYQRLALTQRLAGSFGSGGAARAQFIRDKIVPALEAELAELQRQQTAAAGDPALAREIAEAIAAKQNDILEAQLEAMEQTAESTQESAVALAAMAGAIGFEFGGQRFLDGMLAAGVGA